ncbi:hypothetical protein F2P56_003938 [Juglans regia]|uniref:Uncharacterized protein n=2 Tax=Juglans regia TaxID=51240 RepID=A0A834D5N2_JUGRE|nr:uncharacterized protein LOC109016288 [Juglans regia]KAF5477288.1 hypothetical protein F2P56_003938 [Juglans regia]
MESLKKFVRTIVNIFSNEYLRSLNPNDIARLLAVGEQRRFPIASSHNDINMLERSFIFTELAQGRALPVNYSINGNDYTMGYYIAYGIYQKWSTFLKMIPSPQGNKKKYFVAAQKSGRKDVERAFGMKELTNIMKACVILHNKIIEDERDDNQGPNIEYDQVDDDIP